MNSNITSYTPVWHWCVTFLLLMSCSHEPFKQLEPSYTWSTSDYSYSSFHPFYHDGHYYIFPYSNGAVSIVKFDEKDGKIVYDNFLFSTNELPNFIREYYIDGNMLILPHEQYLRTIDLTSGTLLYTDTMPHYLDRTLRVEGKFSGASYVLDKGRFEFIDILKKQDRYYDTLIYDLDIMQQSYLFQGFPPLYNDGRWIMGTSFSEKENLLTKNRLLIKDNKGTISTLPYCYDNDWGFGQSNNFVVDANNIYVLCAEKIYSYRKIDLYKNWELYIEKGSLGQGLKLSGDKLYFLSEQYKLHVIDKYTGQQQTTMPGPVSSSRMYIFGNKLYFIGRSPANFYKVDLKTLKYDYNYRDEESPEGYDIGFSVSQKSKLLFNHKKWLCTPL